MFSLLFLLLLVNIQGSLIVSGPLYTASILPVVSTSNSSTSPAIAPTQVDSPSNTRTSNPTSFISYNSSDSPVKITPTDVGFTYSPTSVSSSSPTAPTFTLLPTNTPTSIPTAALVSTAPTVAGYTDSPTPTNFPGANTSLSPSTVIPTVVFTASPTSSSTDSPESTMLGQSYSPSAVPTDLPSNLPYNLIPALSFSPSVTPTNPSFSPKLVSPTFVGHTYSPTASLPSSPPETFIPTIASQTYNPKPVTVPSLIPSACASLSPAFVSFPRVAVYFMVQFNSTNPHVHKECLLQNASVSIVQDSCTVFGNCFNLSADSEKSAYFLSVMTANTSDTALLEKWRQKLGEYFSNLNFDHRLSDITTAVCVEPVCSYDGRPCNVSSVYFPCSTFSDNFDFTSGVGANYTSSNLIACNNFLESTTSLPVPLWLFFTGLAIGALILVLISIASYKCCPEIRITLVLTVTAGFFSLYFLAKFFIKLFLIMQGGYACNELKLKLLFPVAVALFSIALLNNWNLVRLFFNSEMRRSSLNLSKEPMPIEGEQSLIHAKIKRRSSFFRWYYRYRCAAWCIFAMAGVVFDSILLINSFFFHANFLSVHVSENGLAQLRVLGIFSILLQNAPMLALLIYVSQEQTGFTSEVVAVMSLNLALLLFSLLKRGVVLGHPSLHHCCRNICLRRIRSTRKLGKPLSCSNKFNVLCCYFFCCVGSRLLRKTFRVKADEKLPCPIELSCCFCPLPDPIQDDIMNDDDDFEQELMRDHEDEALTPSEILWRKSHLANEIHIDEMAQLAEQLLTSGAGRRLCGRTLHSEKQKPTDSVRQLQVVNTDIDAARQFVQEKLKVLLAKETELCTNALRESEKYAADTMLKCHQSQECTSDTMNHLTQTHMRYLDKMLESMAFDLMSGIESVLLDSPLFKIPLALESPGAINAAAHYFAVEISSAWCKLCSNDLSSLIHLQLNELHAQTTKNTLKNLVDKHQSDRAFLISKWKNADCVALESCLKYRAEELQQFQWAQRERTDISKEISDYFEILEGGTPFALTDKLSEIEALESLAKQAHLDHQETIKKQQAVDKLATEKVAAFRTIVDRFVLLTDSQRAQEPVMKKASVELLKLDEDMHSQLELMQTTLDNALFAPNQLRSNVILPEVTIDMNQSDFEAIQNALRASHEARMAALRREYDLKCLAIVESIAPKRQGKTFRQAKDTQSGSSDESRRLLLEMEADINRLEADFNHSRAVQRAQILANREKKINIEELALEPISNGEVEVLDQLSADDSILRTLQADHEYRLSELRRRYHEQLKNNTKIIINSETAERGTFQDEIDRLLKEMEVEKAMLDEELRFTINEAALRAAHEAKLNKLRKGFHLKIATLSNRELVHEPGSTDSEPAPISEIIAGLMDEMAASCARLDFQFESDLKFQRSRIRSRKSMLSNKHDSDIESRLQLKSEECIELASNESKLRADYELRMLKLREKYLKAVETLVKVKGSAQSSSFEEQCNRLMEEMELEQQLLSQDFNRLCSNELRQLLANRRKKRKISPSLLDKESVSVLLTAQTNQDNVHNAQPISNLANITDESLHSKPEAALKAAYEARVTELRRALNNRISLLVSKCCSDLASPISTINVSQEIDRMMSEFELEHELLQYEFEHHHLTLRELILARKRKLKLRVKAREPVSSGHWENHKEDSVNLVCPGDKMSEDTSLPRLAAAPALLDDSEDAPLLLPEENDDVPLLLVLPEDVEFEEERMRREHHKRLDQLRMDYETKLCNRPASVPITLPTVGNFAATVMSQIEKIQQQHDEELAILSATGQIQKAQQAQVSLNLKSKRRARMEEHQVKKLFNSRSNIMEKSPDEDENTKLSQPKQLSKVEENARLQLDILRRAEKEHVSMLLQHHSAYQNDALDHLNPRVSEKREQLLPLSHSQQSLSETNKIMADPRTMDDFIKIARLAATTAANLESDHETFIQSSDFDRRASLPSLSSFVQASVSQSANESPHLFQDNFAFAARKNTYNQDARENVMLVNIPTLETLNLKLEPLKVHNENVLVDKNVTLKNSRNQSTYLGANSSGSLSTSASLNHVASTIANLPLLRTVNEDPANEDPSLEPQVYNRILKYYCLFIFIVYLFLDSARRFGPVRTSRLHTFS